MGKASSASKNKWNAKSYDRLAAFVPKGMRDTFKAACQKRGVTMNAVIRDAVERFIEETELADNPE